eukprot:795004-Amphidinium_carterae.1
MSTSQNTKLKGPQVYTCEFPTTEWEHLRFWVASWLALVAGVSWGSVVVDSNIGACFAGGCLSLSQLIVSCCSANWVLRRTASTRVLMWSCLRQSAHWMLGACDTTTRIAAQAKGEGVACAECFLKDLNSRGHLAVWHGEHADSSTAAMAAGYRAVTLATRHARFAVQHCWRGERRERECLSCPSWYHRVSWSLLSVPVDMCCLAVSSGQCQS